VGIILKMMEKHTSLVCLGMFLLVLSFAAVTANTLVGGKIYNSDFSETISGADVSVQCGEDTLETESLSDGAYAVTFDSDTCYSAIKVYVTATKGTLTGKEDSIINNSSESEGEYVAVGNVNIKAPGSTVNVTIRRGHSGGFFLCGNTVCDSGETYATCAKDCPFVDNSSNNSLVPLIAPLDNSGGNGNSNPQTTENQSNETGNNAPGITGAVTGVGDGDGDSLWYWLVGIILLLVIIIGTVAWIRGSKKESWESN
jgi:hypothetical protein